MKKQRKNRYLFWAGLGVFVCLVFLSGLPVKRFGMKEPPKAYESQEVQEVSAALVQIRAGEASGSGVIYGEQDENLLILTAGHVLEHTEGEIQILFQDGFTAKSSVYRKAEHADMAFIRVPFSEISPENAEGYTPVRTDKKAYDALQKGDRILVTGKEWDGTVSASWGVLEEPWIYAEDFDQHMMLVRGTAGHGMSGGGVFDEAGNFIGILCGKSMAENAAEGESAGSIGEELAVLPLGVIAAGYQEMFLNKDP